MPNNDVLNIINIHSIGTEHNGGNDNCCTVKSTETMHETNRAEKCYTNTDSISKSDNTGKPTVNNKLSNTINYFLPCFSHDSEQEKECHNHTATPNRF